MKTVRRTSTKGYRSDSPDRNNPFNVIKSGDISMKGVPHPVVGFDNTGAVKLMRPGGEYSFPGDTVLELPLKGGSFKPVKKANLGMRVFDGDPIKHQEKVRALGPNGETIYVPAGEGHIEDPENYLNLERLDSILQGLYPDSPLRFGQFRDAVRAVEAGPNSKDPYTQIQYVNTKDGPVPVRRELQPEYGSGAYQFDYPTAKTAYNRLKSIADKRDLDYPLITDEELMYPSELAPELQDMLFTAHFAKDQGSSVKDVLSSTDNWAKNWYTGHYKGEDTGRMDHFNDVISFMNFPTYQDSGVIPPPPREDKLTQEDERSYFEMGADILRGLAQPLNYMREIGEGNYVPTQAELESQGINPMDAVIALANPADHIYAALAAEGLISDPNYKKEEGLTYGTPGLLGLVAGTAANRVEDVVEGAFDLAKSSPDAAEPVVGLLRKLGLKTTAPKINMGTVSNKPASPETVFSGSPAFPKYTPAEGLIVDVDASQGNEFVRRFYSDPQVQQHFRDLLGTNPTKAHIDDAIQMMQYDAAEIAKKQRAFDPSTATDIDQIIENRRYVESLGPDFDADKFLEAVNKSEDPTILESLFFRGQRTPDTTLDFAGDLDRYAGAEGGAAGLYNPSTESIRINPRVRSDASIGAHEGKHFADSRFLSTANGDSSNPNAAQKILNGLSESIIPEFQSHVRARNFAVPDDGPIYLANADEITARVLETQRYMADILLNSKNPRISSLPKKDKVAILLGDFSKLDESDMLQVFDQTMSGLSRDNRHWVLEFYNQAVKGAGDVRTGNISPEKRKAISNLFKNAATVTGVGIGIGSMQSEGQTSGSMYAGGKIKLKKKETPGFSLIKGRS